MSRKGSDKSVSNDPRQLAQIFDQAWSEFVRIEGEIIATEENRKSLAARIVALARNGEKDVDAIAHSALIYLRALRAARELSNSNANILSFPFKPTGASFGPEKVRAMAAAFELCLNELPLRIPSDARATITSAIFDAASEGEADAVKLMDAGLRALRARNI